MSETGGTADSGGNTGGNVTTGDEHVEIIEVNIGPTKPKDEDEEEANTPPPAPEEQCDPRLRECATQNPTRTR